MKYQFVAMGNSKTFNSLSEIPYAISGYTKDCTVERRNGALVHRQELDNRPTFRGFLGPMWNGTTDEGEPIFRYETQEVYNLLCD